MTVTPRELAVMSTDKQYDRLRKLFPAHNVMPRRELANIVHDLRFGEGGRSWAHVAAILNDNAIIHSQWRRDRPWWDERIVRQFADRFNVVERHIRRSNFEDGSQLTLAEIEEPAATITEVTETFKEPLPEKALDYATPSAHTTEITFKADGDDYTLRGVVTTQRRDDPKMTVEFRYEGAPNNELLEFLHTYGAVTIHSL